MTLRTTDGGWRHAAVWLVCCCSPLVATNRVVAQNLVPNPSFEENTACPVTISFQGFSKPLHWEKWNESPDYFHACSGSLGGVDTLITVPLNGFGFQHALQGDAYVGMLAYGALAGGVNYREYVGCQLLEPLVVGTSYDLSFFTNVAFGGSYWSPTQACNNMGMLFSMRVGCAGGACAQFTPMTYQIHITNTHLHTLKQGDRVDEPLARAENV